MAFIGPWGTGFNQLGSTTVNDGFQLGSRVETADGRAFRIVQNNVTNAMVAGDLQQAVTLEAQHQNMACATTPAGSTSVTVTLGSTAVTAGDYDGGTLMINAGTGAGRTYLVKSTPGAALSTTLVVTLAEPIETALLASDSKACLQPNLYKKVVISATAQTGVPVGVAPIAVPASSYGFVQTQGACAVRADETFAAGQALTVGTGVAGEVEALDAAGEPQIGIAWVAGTDNERRACVLTMI